MSFPYTYSEKIYFTKEFEDVFQLSEIIRYKLLRSGFVANKEQQEKFTVNSPFLKIPFAFGFELKHKELKYKINLEVLIKIILITVIFTALLSYNSLSFFFIFTVIFSIVFYSLNLLIINSFIKSNIIKILKENDIKITEEENILEEQKEWMNDPERCPACGTFLSEIDLVCPECGLHLKRTRHSIPLDTSKYKKEQVKYHYKKK